MRVLEKTLLAPDCADGEQGEKIRLPRPVSGTKLLLCQHCVWQCLQCQCNEMGFCAECKKAGCSDLDMLPSEWLADDKTDGAAAGSGVAQSTFRMWRCGCCRRYGKRTVEYSLRAPAGPLPDERRAQWPARRLLVPAGLAASRSQPPGPRDGAAWFRCGCPSVRSFKFGGQSFLTRAWRRRMTKTNKHRAVGNCRTAENKRGDWSRQEMMDWRRSKARSRGIRDTMHGADTLAAVFSHIKRHGLVEFLEKDNRGQFEGNPADRWW